MNNDSIILKNQEQTLIKALEDMKAKNILSISTKNQSSVTDVMIIVSGTSVQHVKSLASNVVQNCKQAGFPPLSVQGLNKTGWVIVDLGDIVVNVMTESSREFYDLENLWQIPQNTSSMFENNQSLTASI